MAPASLATPSGLSMKLNSPIKSPKSPSKSLVVVAATTTPTTTKTTTPSPTSIRLLPSAGGSSLRAVVDVAQLIERQRRADGPLPEGGGLHMEGAPALVDPPAAPLLMTHGKPAPGGGGDAGVGTGSTPPPEIRRDAVKTHPQLKTFSGHRKTDKETLNSLSSEPGDKRNSDEVNQSTPPPPSRPEARLGLVLPDSAAAGAAAATSSTGSATSPHSILNNVCDSKKKNATPPTNCLQRASSQAPSSLSRPSITSSTLAPASTTVEALEKKAISGEDAAVAGPRKPTLHQDSALVPSSRDAGCVLDDQLRRHARLIRRSQLVLRRARRLQGRHADVHARAEVAQLVKGYRSRLVSTGPLEPEAPVEPSNNEVTVDAAGNVFFPSGVQTSRDLKAELLQNEDVKSLSTAALVNLVKRLENAQQNHKKEESPPQPSLCGIRLDLEEEGAQRLDAAASALTLQLATVRRRLDDSDATESSSGGESEEEAEYDAELNQHYKSVPLYRRPTWKWAKDRAAVAARWTWLHAQVSDLEYRIRQMSDLYRSIRANKGAVVLETPQHNAALSALPDLSNSNRQTLSVDSSRSGPSSSSSSSSPFPASSSSISSTHSSLDRRESSASISGPGRPSPPVPAVPPPGTPHLQSDASNKCDETFSASSSSASSSSSCAIDPTCIAARCRPVKSYRRRKLLRMTGLHHVARKAARPVTLSCGCWPPSPTHLGGHTYSTCCAICTGRAHVVQPLDAEAQSFSERLAILDPSFHPVLSFPQDIPLDAQLESILKSGKLQSPSLDADFPGSNNNNKKTSPTSASSNSVVGTKTSDSSAKGTKRDRQKASKMKKQMAVAGSAAGEKLAGSEADHGKADRTVAGGGEASREISDVPVAGEIKRESQSTKTISAAEIKRQKRRLERLNKKNFLKKVRRDKPTTPLTLSNVSASQSGHNGFLLDGAAAASRLFSETGSRTSSRASSPAPSLGETPSTPTGPLSQSAPSSTLKEKIKKHSQREGSRAYDINNIVIPYSMASSTRVEKLQYKEIITPSWRTLEAGDEKEDPNSAMSSHFICSEEVLPPSPSQSPVPKLPRSSGTSGSTGNIPVQLASDLTNSPSSKIPHQLPPTRPRANSVTDVTALKGAAASRSTTPTSGATMSLALKDVSNEAAVTAESLVPPKTRSTSRRDGSKSNLVVRIVNEDEEEIEDLSDEAVFRRHQRYEFQEKKRYTNFLLPGRRGPRSTRSDSGTNTPDPTSPDSALHHFGQSDSQDSNYDNAMDVPSPAAAPSPGPSYDDRALDGFPSAAAVLATIGPQVPANHPKSKRRPSVPRRDRNFSSGSVGGVGGVGGPSSATTRPFNDLDGFYSDATDDDYDAALSGAEDQVTWEPRRFPLNEKDLEELGTNGERLDDDDNDDVEDDEEQWRTDEARVPAEVKGVARGRFSSETSADRKVAGVTSAAEAERSRSASVEPASTSNADPVAFSQNGDGRIAPPLTPSSTSVEDEEELDDDDANDPEWRMEDDDDEDSVKKKLKTQEAEDEAAPSRKPESPSGAGKLKRLKQRKEGKREKDRAREKKSKKKNAFGLKLSSKR